MNRSWAWTPTRRNPGRPFHMNYSAFYEVTTHLRVRFNRYWLQQTTDDKVNGTNLQRPVIRPMGDRMTSATRPFPTCPFVQVDTAQPAGGVPIANGRE